LQLQQTLSPVRNLLPLYTTTKSNSMATVVSALEVYLLQHGTHVDIVNASSP